MVSPGVLSQLQDELQRAVKGEEHARERISAQVTQLEQAQLRWAAVDVGPVETVLVQSYIFMNLVIAAYLVCTYLVIRTYVREGVGGVLVSNEIRTFLL